MQKVQENDIDTPTAARAKLDAMIAELTPDHQFIFASTKKEDDALQVVGATDHDMLANVMVAIGTKLGLPQQLLEILIVAGVNAAPTGCSDPDCDNCKPENQEKGN